MGWPESSKSHIPGQLAALTGGIRLRSLQWLVFINSKDTPVSGFMDKNPRYNAETRRASFLHGVGGLGSQRRWLSQWTEYSSFRASTMGNLTAVNANTGDIAWQVPLGVDDRC
jgi:hypothetical protein